MEGKSDLVFLRKNICNILYLKIYELSMYFYKILLFKVNFAKKYGVMNKQNAVFLFILVISLDPP